MYRRTADQIVKYFHQFNQIEILKMPNFNLFNFCQRNKRASRRENSPTSVVELSLSAKDLPTSKNVHYKYTKIVMCTHDPVRNLWQEIHHSEPMESSTENPEFPTKIKLEYRFEEKQKVKFSIYKVLDEEHKFDLNHENLVGSVETTLGSLTAQRVSIINMKPSGNLIVHAIEKPSMKKEIEMKLIAKDLDKKSNFGQSNAFVVISKSTADGDVEVHKTEVINDKSNPQWKKFSIPLDLLTDGDYDRPLKLKCYHKKWIGSNLIGESTFTLRQLLSTELPLTLPCLNAKKQEKHEDYVDSGKFQFVHAQLLETPTFIDYIHGGTKINCFFGIDFSASNENPVNPKSCHYLYGGPTAYEQALSAVGDIVEDIDNRFTVLGFGARKTKNSPTDNQFVVKLNAENPYCHGSAEMLSAYRSNLKTVVFDEQSNLAPCIRMVSKLAGECEPDDNRYFVQTIVTTGEISDMDETLEALVDASHLPISFVIVGVGDSKFKKMTDKLVKSDGSPLTAPSGRTARSNMVKFVRFDEFVTPELTPADGKADLGAEILHAVHDQFMYFMKSNNILPKALPCPEIMPRAPSTPEISIPTSAEME